MSQSRLWAALGCVGTVVGRLALLCYGKEKSHSGQRFVWWSETECFTCASLLFIVVSVFFSLCLEISCCGPLAAQTNFQPISIRSTCSVNSEGYALFGLWRTGLLSMLKKTTMCGGYERRRWKCLQKYYFRQLNVRNTCRSWTLQIF